MRKELDVKVLDMFDIEELEITVIRRAIRGLIKTLKSSRNL